MDWRVAGLNRMVRLMLKDAVDLGAEDRRVLGDWLAAEDHVDGIIREDPCLNQVFMKIERVFASDPVFLEGEDVPSLAHNRLTVFLGEQDPETGDRIAGQEIFSALLSERSLCYLMMRTNRSETEAVMTADRIFGRPVERQAPREDGFIGEALEEAISRTSERTPGILRACREKLRDAPVPVSRKLGMEIASALGQDLQRRGDFSFALERHMENVQKRNVATRVEAAHTVLHADRVIEALSRPRLEPPPQDGPHPLARALLRPADARLSTLLAQACERELHRQLRRAGLRMEDFPDGLSDASARSRLRAVGEGFPDLVRDLLRMRSWHLGQPDRERPEVLLTASVSFTQGQRGGGHSDLVSLGHEYVRLTIGLGEFDVSFGNRKTRMRDEILDFEMSPEDFMLLIRGHPEGLPVRCNMVRLAGRGIEQAPYRNAFQDEIEKTVSKDMPTDPEVERIRRQLVELVGNGMTRKAQKEEALRLLDALEERLSESIPRSAEAVRSRAADLEEMDRSNIREALVGMRQDRILEALAGKRAGDDDTAPEIAP